MRDMLGANEPREVRRPAELERLFTLRAWRTAVARGKKSVFYVPQRAIAEAG